MAVVCLTVLGAIACSGGTPDQSPTPVVTTTPDDMPTMVQAKVVEVLDGVTIDAEIDGKVYRVRYLGVELANGADTGSLAQEALEFNRYLVAGQTIELEMGPADTDFEGNLLRYVYVDGEMANLSLLVNGYATVADSSSEFRYQAEFYAAQENAREGLRGIWESRRPANSRTPATASSPTPTPPFTGGTLPKPPSAGGQTCDYSGTGDGVIKGNVDTRTGDHVYHVPTGLYYSTTSVDESLGDRWFCTEEEAVAAGWKKSKR